MPREKAQHLRNGPFLWLAEWLEYEIMSLIRIVEVNGSKRHNMNLYWEIFWLRNSFLCWIYNCSNNMASNFQIKRTTVSLILDQSKLGCWKGKVQDEKRTLCQKWTVSVPALLNWWKSATFQSLLHIYMCNKLIPNKKNARKYVFKHTYVIIWKLKKLSLYFIWQTIEDF